MADLSAYIDFSVVFDLSGSPKLILTDNSSYPTGVAVDVIGKFDIKQPDCITRAGDFNAPDVEWDGTALTSYEETLRPTLSENYQQGTYIITYTVDHPGYTPTTLSRTINFQYTPVSLVIQKDFDVFTPSLRLLDNTNYSTPGYSVVSQSNAWSAVFTVGSTSTSVTDTNVSIFDLAYTGSYYDSIYNLSFEKQITYLSRTYAYLTVLDTLYYDEVTSADSPPTMAVLLGYVDDIKTRYDASVTSCSADLELKQLYIYAMTLFSHIRYRLCVSNTNGLYEYVQELIRITHNYRTPVYTNTNAPITPFSFDFCNSGSSTSSSVIIEVIVGSAAATLLGINAGDTVITNADFANHNLEIFRGNINIPGIDPLDGGTYFTKVFADNFVTLSTMLYDNELLKIKTL